jgi:hypothetical protein
VLQPAEHAGFLLQGRVAQAEADEEAVELGLGEREGALVIDRVLGGDDEEGRFEAQFTLRARARASMVLATPGTSSSRMWPSQRYATRQRVIWGFFPRMTFSMFARTRAAMAATSMSSRAAGRAGVSGPGRRVEESLADSLRDTDRHPEE